MPQPLSKVLRTAGAAFGPGFIDLRPELASLVASTISHHSYNELQVSFIYHELFKGDGVDAFQKLNDSRARRQKVIKDLRLQAKSILNIEEYDTLANVLKRFESAAKIRDKYAHGLWGISDQLADSLLLIDTKVYQNVFSYTMKTLSIGGRLDIEKARFPDKKILVYNRSDLRRQFELIKNTHKILYEVVGAFSIHEGEKRVERFREIGAQLGI
jgi:hypothetical protein